ncbi:response regulator [Massilia sp. TN1-12]|uniref:response regulator n=1 Tax=Massilia paldalensis TaxID=3377675 RepID=UPI0038508122
MKVLIVDDDVVARMMLMHMIDGAGMAAGAAAIDVQEAEDGEDAWGRLEAGLAPSILFCDLRMPRLSGMELLARVKADARFTGLPFVLVSAANDAATMEQALGLGAAGFIVKPFDGDKVAQHLANVLPTRGSDAAAAPDHGAEPPDAVTRRLGIDVARLVIYLGGLQRQLHDAAPELERLLAASDIDAARLRLARLAEGCRTLGLEGAGASLEAQAAAATLERAAVARALDAAGAATQHQTEAAHRLLH